MIFAWPSTVYGMTSTVGVTQEMMIAHGRAVAHAANPHACVVVDLPFGSYEGSPTQVFRTAAHIMAETGCAAVRLEGGAVMAETIDFLTTRGVPVMAHIGLTPQAVNHLAATACVAVPRSEPAAIMEDAVAVAGAGAFSVVERRWWAATTWRVLVGGASLDGTANFASAMAIAVKPCAYGAPLRGCGA